jgi:tetratricopeptide (TPR) repeat protein
MRIVNYLFSRLFALIVMGLFYFSIVNAYSQTSRLDSLVEALYNHPEEDIIRAEILSDIIHERSQLQTGSVYEGSVELLKLSHKIKYKVGVAYAAYTLATHYSILQDWENMFYYYHIAERIYQSTNSPYGLSKLVQLKSSYYVSTGELELALRALQEALNYFRSDSIIEEQASLHISMSRLYGKLHRYSDQEESLLNALALMRQTGDELWQLFIYQHLTSMYMETSAYDKAEKCLLIALDLQERIQHQHVSTFLKFNFAQVQAHKKRFNLAMQYFEEAIEGFKSIGVNDNLAIAMLHKSNLFWEMGRYEDALVTLKDGLSIVLSKETSPFLIADYHIHFYERYKELGRFKEALESYETAQEYKSGVFSVETMNKISELKESYEAEIREQENNILRNKNELSELKLRNRNLFIYGLSVFLIFGGFILYLLNRNSRVRLERRAAHLEQRVLRSRMNPHFIFNALMSIQSYVYQNEPSQAGKYLGSFAKLMRSVLENSGKEYISLGKEEEWLRAYIALQLLRFENRVDCILEIDESLDKDNTMLPSMLTQPFIENKG